MKTTNLDSEHQLDVTRGRKNPNTAGSSGITVRDATSTGGPVWDVTVIGGTWTFNDDGTATLTIGDGSGGATPIVNDPITANISNPPTQAELEDAIGSPPSEVTGQWWVLTDSDTGLHYGVVSNGDMFLFWPLDGAATGEVIALGTAAGTTNGFHSMHSAFAYDATSGLVFGCYLNSAGDVQVAAWTTAGVLTQGPTTLRAALSAGDSHAVPVLVVRSSDRKVVVWYCAHNGTQMYQRISSAAADVSAFAAEVNLDSQLGGANYTYPMAHELNDGLYLFYRRTSGGTDQQWAYSVSTDGGATWAAETVLAQEPSHWGYLGVSKTAEDRLDFMWADRSAFDESGASLYHFYMLAGGDIFETDGTEITATKPIAAANMTQVWAASGTAEAEPWGSVQLTNGNPRLSFVTFDSTSPEDVDYRWAAWNGSGWWTTMVASAGSGSQTATAVLEPGAPNALWYSKDDGTTAEIFRSTTLDGGASWTSVQVTDGSTEENALLFPIWNAPNAVKVGWQRAASWTRNATVAATFYMAGIVTVPSEVHVGRTIILYGENFGDALAELIWRISSTGALEFSIDGGVTWYGAGSGIDGGGGGHVHIIGEPFVGDGAQTVYYLAQEAELDSVAAYTGAGARVAITQDGTELDKITFTAAPAAGTGFIDYIPATN